MIDYFSSYSRGNSYRGGNGFDYFSAYSDSFDNDYKKKNDKSFINRNGELEHQYPSYGDNDY